MPQITHQYPFELKVVDFAQRLSHQLGLGDHSFLMVLNAKGAVETLHFKCPDETWFKLEEKLRQADMSYLFYDPFAPDYTYLCWQRIDRSVMERLIDGHFENADFVKYIDRKSRMPELKPPPDQFPASWGVMF